LRKDPRKKRKEEKKKENTNECPGVRVTSGLVFFCFMFSLMVQHTDMVCLRYETMQDVIG
jgi:hypothetical protein